MRKTAFFKWAIFLPVITSLFLGCGGKGKGVKTIEGDPETLYKQGLARFNKRDYPEALKIFGQLKSSFPDSPPYTLWAELKIGDCHFHNKEYVEAIAAYEEFKKIHPTHEEIPYVQYQIGTSYFNQILTLDRDQTFAKRALSNFEYLVANYPPSIFTEKAKEKIGVCKKRLADHEFYVGNYYYKTEKFKAASVRFQNLIEKFPGMPEEDKTLFFLGKSYVEIDRREKAIEAFTKIVTQYPNSTHYEEAKAILDQGVIEKQVPARKTKAKKAKKVEIVEPESERLSLIRFEAEGRRPVLRKKEEEKIEEKKIEERVEPPPVTSESINPPPPREEIQGSTTPLTTGPMQEGQSQILSIFPPSEEKRTFPVTELRPEEEKEVSQREISTETKLKAEVKPEEEKRMPALPNVPHTSEERGPKKEVLPQEPMAKLVDTGQPIDITSDKVETYLKENLIVFKGNVVARQKDIVIYADSLEAVIIEDGKGIEKVIAGGNVKVQQGLRVASCQRAVFYNLDRKVILTGAPKILEGDNLVSGDEIIFDIEKNRVEVKGGSGSRGKAKIYPGAEIEKLK